jgi:hypothetical protein
MNDKNKIEVFNKEFEYIKDERLKDNAKKIVSMLPDYFFEVAASSTGKYHPSFSLGDAGLVRHSKVAVRIGKELLDNNSLGHKFTDKEKDLILISILVHDGLKHGLEMQKYTQFDHPILMANFIKDNKDKFSFEDSEIDFITNCISSHMGEWNTNSYSNVVLPLPINKYQRFVHMCDFLSSRKFLDVKFENNDIVE